MNTFPLPLRPALSTLPALLALASLLPGTLAARLAPAPAEVLFLPGSKSSQDQPVIITDVEVSARIAGLMAETTVTIVFSNPNSRPMEGELSYPLPPDATIVGYALDIGGRMVDGVPVPKQKARVAFDEEQRKGIDPGLVEWSGGNRFQTRVSPIPAHGQRTVRLRYTSMLHSADGSTLYRLPLNFEKAGHFRLRIESLAGGKPTVHPTGLGNLSFQEAKNFYVLEREWRDLTLKEDLVIDLPEPERSACLLENCGGSCYFSGIICESPASSALPAADRIDLVWDVSGSMSTIDKAPIFEFLKLYFASRAAQPCTVRLVTVRDKVEAVKELPLVNGDAMPLVRELEAQHDDGATADLSLCLNDAAPLRFVVTDGNVNFSPVSNKQDAPGVTTYALIAGSGTERAALRSMGALPIDLLKWTPAQALQHSPSWKIESILLDGKPWKESATSAPDGVIDGPVLLTGILPEGGEHTIDVTIRNADGAVVKKSIGISGAADRAVSGTLNRSFYAQNKLAALLLEPKSPARDELTKQLGQEYGIVTPGTSLLVLETLEQYLHHEVRPPASCPELRQEYDRAVTRQTEQNARNREASLASQKQTAREERKHILQWHQKTFPAPRQTTGGKSESNGNVPSPTPVVTAHQEGAFLGSAGSLSDTVLGSAGPLPDTETLGSAQSQPATVAREASSSKPASPVIRVLPWTSGAPYLAALKASADPVSQYYDLKKKHAASPGFYLDCADFFESVGNRAMAVQVLSNLVEMDLENRSLLRAAAYRLRFMGETKKAVFLFEKVKEAFPEEPQSYRDLALALADLGCWQEAADTMRQVLERSMDARFHGIEQIAADELAHIVLRAQEAGCPVQTEGIDPVFLKPVDADLRVVINWDTDLSDMDLWVTGPDGEKCFYSHKNTSTGGRISRDVTEGYGPEEFMIRKALPGAYKVQANYFGSRTMKMLAPVTLYAELYTDYARAGEQKKTLVFRLGGKKETVEIAQITHGHALGSAQPRDYQVRAGETWQSIAAKELGDAARAGEILSLNPGSRLDAPPATGSIIRLPE